MNLEEGYDHSWIYKESGTKKSSRSKKASDNGYALTPSDDRTSMKDKKQSCSKTLSKALVSKVNNVKIEKHAQSTKTRDKGSDFPSTESPASTKGNELQTLEDMSKTHKYLFLELKNGENTNVVPLTKYNINDESCAIRGRRGKNSSISNQDDHHSFVSILKDANLTSLPE
jgi:hypothetical protein